VAAALHEKPGNRADGDMDERSKINHWLQSLTGRNDAALGVDRTYRLLLGRQLTITIFVPDGDARLMLLADVMRIDALTPDFLVEVAAINLRFDLTGGMTVGLEKTSSTVIAFTHYALGSLDFDAFQRLLAIMETTLLKLRPALEAMAQASYPSISARQADSSLGALA
jgi:Tir chaperone protein (CesT) family